MSTISVGRSYAVNHTERSVVGFRLAAKGRDKPLRVIVLHQVTTQKTNWKPVILTAILPSISYRD